MVYAKCINCGHRYHWEWVEAFSKFGFKDGDGQVETHSVAFVLEEAGYEVKTWKWFVHNELIIYLSKDDVEFLPTLGAGYLLGYDHPRKFLPKEVIELLDEAFPTTSIYPFP
ncbi:MAG: hypothetical protein COA45_04235 [Zetaproteobacteria bacterium]|nr:MAG: hypothetical protein COA45_04235 [Zetaproteobacteria bacterium]